MPLKNVSDLQLSNVLESVFLYSDDILRGFQKKIITWPLMLWGGGFYIEKSMSGTSEAWEGGKKESSLVCFHYYEFVLSFVYLDIKEHTKRPIRVLELGK